MTLTMTFVFIICLRIVTATAASAAFGLSGIGQLIGEQISFGSVPHEYISGGIALIIMIGITGLRWNSDPIPRNLSLAIAGTMFHVPAALQGSGAHWLNVAPSLIPDSAATEVVFMFTFLVLIVTCVLGVIIDSAKEETSDLLERGLSEESVRTIVKQAALFKAGTLVIGFMLLMFMSFIPTGVPDSLPPAILALVGVLIIIIPIVIYFESWTLRNVSDKEA